MSSKREITPRKWRQPATYFRGTLATFVTFPALAFALGIAIGYWLI